jgi:Kef-type K+ transport system membrane component KefB
MVEFITFFMLLAAGLVFSELFRKIHLPYVTALIVAGIIIGPQVLGLADVNESMIFISSIGLIFLMFIAGTEVKIGSLQKIEKRILLISAINGLLPLIVGIGIGLIIGLSLFQSLLIGVIFISSSVAVIIPSLEINELLHTKLGRTIITATVFEDIASLLALSLILQTTNPTAAVPLPIYFPIVVFIVVLLKIAVPWLEKDFREGKLARHFFEDELKFVFIVLLATVILFEILGMHSIIAGFVTGMILAESIKGKVLEKIHTISYGIFIPVFFVLIGIQTDLNALVSGPSILSVTLIVLGLIISKIISGWIGGKLVGFSQKESVILGISTIPQLSTTLAIAFSANEFNLLPPEIISSIIILSIITTNAAPILIRAILDIYKKPQSNK